MARSSLSSSIYKIQSIRRAESHPISTIFSLIHKTYWKIHDFTTKKLWLLDMYNIACRRVKKCIQQLFPSSLSFYFSINKYLRAREFNQICQLLQKKRETWRVLYSLHKITASSVYLCSSLFVHFNGKKIKLSFFNFCYMNDSIIFWSCTLLCNLQIF